MITLFSTNWESKKMTKKKLILLYGGEDILSSSIEFILSTRENWKVISISQQEGCETFREAMDTLHPDIVIIHQDLHQDPKHLTLQLLQDHPTIKVIMISLENNMIEVYSKQNVLAQEASDLITVIENSH